MKPQVLLFLTTLAGWMNRGQQQVIEYLVEENRVLKEHLGGKCPNLTVAQRRRLASKGRKLGRAVLERWASLVTPETIYAWHRKFVAMKYTPKTRPTTLASERRAKRNALIIRLAEENRNWGYERIQGVMHGLGYKPLSTSTIGNVLREAGINPSPERGSRLDWKTFIRVHADQLAATDFFMVPVWTMRGLVMYRVHFVIDLLTRRVEITHIAAQWDGSLMQQIARNLTDDFSGFLKYKRYLLMDRDSLFTVAFQDTLRNGGTLPFRLPVNMPMLNGHAERFVKSIKTECLDKLIFFGEGSLRHAIDEYLTHYHRERPHQGLGNQLIEPGSETLETQGEIVKFERLGGLLKHYYRETLPEPERKEPLKAA